MDITHSAKIKDYTFVLSPHYFVIEHKGDAVVSLSPEEGLQAIIWLWNEVKDIVMAQAPNPVPATPVTAPKPPEMPQEARKVVEGVVLPDFTNRRAQGHYRAGKTIVNEVDPDTGKVIGQKQEDIVQKTEGLPPAGNSTGQRIIEERVDDLARIARASGVVIEKGGPDFSNI